MGAHAISDRCCGLDGVQKGGGASVAPARIRRGTSAGGALARLASVRPRGDVFDIGGGRVYSTESLLLVRRKTAGAVRRTARHLESREVLSTYERSTGTVAPVGTRSGGLLVPSTEFHDRSSDSRTAHRLRENVDGGRQGDALWTKRRSPSYSKLCRNSRPTTASSILTRISGLTFRMKFS